MLSIRHFQVGQKVRFFYIQIMFIKDKENFISKSKEIAKRGAILSAAVFAVSFVANAILNIANIASAENIVSNVSVFSILFFILSVVCLFLIQLEAWEREGA